MKYKRVMDVSLDKLLEIYLRDIGPLRLVWDDGLDVYSIELLDGSHDYVGADPIETILLAIEAFVEAL